MLLALLPGLLHQVLCHRGVISKRSPSCVVNSQLIFSYNPITNVHNPWSVARPPGLFLFNLASAETQKK
eukprot:5437597-Amphidinium_carterae.1